ncbi:MAE_28990/MAE_18760 family HEPN-like nuclease [Roseomonas gilardii]|uniref:MAE_28990/MAE_18760 family HEPN-like nuclease n=1 Tax=Roseomonas gilardii TaxID=257708 RepID=UPI0021B4F67E|nr:MAE_28990/MAE_18760 family HEPN-like nuclease [Roseomonas gilardii]
MRPFLVQFHERRREVRRYLAVLLRAEREIDNQGLRRHDRELNVLRAAAILLLYNTVEAAARAGIQSIYDEIELTGTSLDELCEPLRRRVLRDFRSNATDRGIDAVGVAAKEMAALSFDPRRIFGGNVDARELRSQSSDYGFTIDADGRRTRMGEDLVIIKRKRNDLAHGITSFSEVGRDYTAKQIREMALRSLGYMEAMLTSIDNYLTSKQFRASGT